MLGLLGKWFCLCRHPYRVSRVWEPPKICGLYFEKTSRPSSTVTNRCYESENLTLEEKL